MVDVETLRLGCMTEVAKNEICPRCGYPEGTGRNPIALPERTLLSERFYDGAARYSLGEEMESLSVTLTPGYAPFEQYFRSKLNMGVAARCATQATSLVFQVIIDSAGHPNREENKVHRMDFCCRYRSLAFCSRTSSCAHVSKTTHVMDPPICNHR